MSFKMTWDALQAQLTVGRNIQKWSQYAGLLPGTFSILKVNPKYIEVKPLNAVATQPIQRRHFEAVYNVWSDYRKNRITRTEIGELTRFSTYIISILYWLECQGGGKDA